MLRILFLIVWSLDIIALILKQKSKILAAISFVMSFILCAGNNSNPDYLIYYWNYLYNNDNGSKGLDIGYRFYCSIFRSLGLSYQQMLIITQIILLFLLFVSIRKITDNWCAFWALYFFAEQFIDIIQIRNYMATIFLLIAICFLHEKKKNASIIVVLIASTFHLSFALYLPFIVLYGSSRYVKIRDYYKKISVVFLITYATFYLLNILGINVLGKILRQFIFFDRYSVYATTRTRFGSIIYVGLYFLTLWCIYNDRQKESQVLFDWDSIISNLNLYISIILPLLVINTNAYRLLRNLNIINYAYFAFVLDTKFRDIKSYWKFAFKCLLTCLAWKINFIYSNNRIFTTIYENNLWIGSKQ